MTLSPHWPRYPSIYEINTWVWLSDLESRIGRPVDLGSVPSDEWDRIASSGFDAVWLMGVWERSPAGIAISNRNASLLVDFQRALPDFATEDNVGSPYCVRRYVVDPQFGARQGLACARDALARRGVRLILDFVPNHVAPDHPWVSEHPEYFIRGTREDARNDPSSFITRGGIVFACGRDPYFPAWPDVVQLNAFDSCLRDAVRTTLSDIADQCDGVRCDMAMLLLNDVFERTWKHRAGPKPETEYWTDAISPTRARHPDFLFIAEAYWGLEWDLQQLGFDFCYDKTLYDRLEHASPVSVRLHMRAEPVYQNRLVRFIENHDEPRAATAFPGAKGRAAAVASSTLPGARLFHEGQFEGRKVRLPVFLARRPNEPPDAELQQFYSNLLGVITNGTAFREGQWRLCELSGWPDNSSYERLVAWAWEHGDQRHLIVVNLTDQAAQAQVRVPWAEVGGRTWLLNDRLSGRTYERSGDELTSGLYVQLDPWNSHLFECQKRNAS